MNKKTTQKEFNSKKGINQLIKTINKKVNELKNNKENVIILIAGGSASGKTTIAINDLHKYFEKNANLISIDDYNKGNKFIEDMKKKGIKISWDEPDYVNLDLLKKHISELKKGNSIKKPIFNFKLSKSDKTEIIKPKKIIIIEGIFALNKKLISEADIKVFIDLEIHGRLLRRLLRESERSSNTPKEALKYFLEMVQPMHKKHIQSTKKYADIIINCEYNPKKESKKINRFEQQVKFKSKISQEIIKNLEAEKITSTIEKDIYYNPKDKDLLNTGEIIRIREQGKNKYFTYKGPKIKSDYTKRVNFSFDIDKETEKVFLKIYGKKQKTIIKERTFYLYQGIIFTKDKVTKIENNKIEELGDFIEIRATKGINNKKKMQTLIKKLNLNNKDAIKKGYFEI